MIINGGAKNWRVLKGKNSTTPHIFVIWFLSNQDPHTRPARCWLNQSCSYFPARFPWARKLWIFRQLHLHRQQSVAPAWIHTRQNWTGIEQKCVLSHAQQLKAGFKCKWHGEDYGNSIGKALWGSFHSAQIVRKNSGCPETLAWNTNMESDLCASLESKSDTSCALLCELSSHISALIPSSHQEIIPGNLCPGSNLLLPSSGNWFVAQFPLCKHCPLKWSSCALPVPGWWMEQELFAFQLPPTTAAASAGRGMVVIWVNSFPWKGIISKNTHQLSKIDTQALLVDWRYPVENRVREFIQTKW